MSKNYHPNEKLIILISFENIFGGNTEKKGIRHFRGRITTNDFRWMFRKSVPSQNCYNCNRNNVDLVNLTIGFLVTINVQT